MHNTKKDDLPAMPFYVGDWLKAPEVRSLPPDVRGLWFDLICYMWESTERGVMVKPNGKPYSNDEIIRMVGLDNQNSGNWLTIIINNSVCAVRQDGAIYSRRMVRDQKIRHLRQEIGKKGGNPMLLVNTTLNQKVNQNNENENENIDINKDKIRISKILYLDCVYLTPDERLKLDKRFGERPAEAWIKKLNDYIQSKGKKYKSHYHTILMWADKDPVKPGVDHNKKFKETQEYLETLKR